MLDTVITITIEALFTVVFIASLIDYVRRRDVLSRDLVAVFGSVSALFVVQFVGLVFGSTPPWLASASAALILARSEEHTSELQSHSDLVCRLLLEKKK